MSEHPTPPAHSLRDWQLGQLSQELREVKERVTRLESTLTRGMLLLVANLAAVIVSLGQQLLHR